MTLSSEARFAELIGSARAALAEVSSAAVGADSAAMMRAVTAASRAAGFLEALTIADPMVASGMIAEFESLMLLMPNAGDETKAQVAE